MNEQEWLECTNPHQMKYYLREGWSERKHRLFACACCRGVWHFLTLEWSRHAVEVAERFADRLGSAEVIVEICREASAFENLIHDYDNPAFPSQDEPWTHAVEAACWSVCMDISTRKNAMPWDTFWDAADFASNCVLRAIQRTEPPSVKLAWDAEESRQAALLRCIFGNPFRPVTINPNWLAWSNGTIRRIAQAIYDERAFERLPILADALEDAGCTDENILNHCRSEGAHVKGCWVVDAVLGMN